MHKTIVTPESTCSLKEADVAIFPYMVTTPLIKQLFDSLDPKDRTVDKIIGAGEFPPVVANRVNENWTKASIGRNIKRRSVGLRVFNPGVKYSDSFMEEYWNQIMFEVQKEPWPTVWIIAPLSICDYFYTECLKDNGGKFYYHQQSAVEEGRQFFLITNDPLPRFHHTKSQKVSFCLS